jgi:hypothetical protein
VHRNGHTIDVTLLSGIAVNILTLYCYFIAPPHLQGFGKVVVQPSVSCIAKRRPQALQCLSSSIFFHPFFPNFFLSVRLVAEGVVAAVTVRQYVFLVIGVATVV